MSIETAKEVIDQSTDEIISCNVGDLNFEYYEEEGLFLNGYEVEKTAISDVKKKFGMYVNAFSEYESNTELLKSMIAHSKRKRAEKRVSVKVKDGIVYKIASADAMSDATLFNAVVDACSWEGVAKVRRVKGSTEFSMVSNISASPPKNVEDISYAGILLRNDDKVTAFPYVHRLVCSNGLTGNKLLTPQVGEKIEDILASARETLTRFINLSEREVKNPGEVMNHTVRNQPARKRSIIMDNLENREGDTLYDLVNIVTSLGNSEEDPSYEALGFNMVNTFADRSCFCPTCNRDM